LEFVKSGRPIRRARTRQLRDRNSADADQGCGRAKLFYGPTVEMVSKNLLDAI
jgi:hypothetical protein